MFELQTRCGRSATAFPSSTPQHARRGDQERRRPALAREVLGWPAQVGLADGLRRRSTGPLLSGRFHRSSRAGHTGPPAELRVWEARSRGNYAPRPPHARHQHLTLPDHQRIAHAFLASPTTSRRGGPAVALKIAAAFAAVLVLALAAPMTWLSPRRRSARARSATSPPPRWATRRPRWPRPTTRTPTAEGDRAPAGSSDLGGQSTVAEPPPWDAHTGRGRPGASSRATRSPPAAPSCAASGGRRALRGLPGVGRAPPRRASCAKVLRPDQAEECRPFRRPRPPRFGLLERIAAPVVVRSFGCGGGRVPFPRLRA